MTLVIATFLALLTLTAAALLLESGYVGDLFVAAAVTLVGAVIVMPAPRRKTVKR